MEARRESGSLLYGSCLKLVPKNQMKTVTYPPHPYSGLGQIYRAFQVYPQIGNDQFMGWGNLELVKLHFSRQDKVFWSETMMKQLLQDRHLKTFRWILDQPKFKSIGWNFDIAVVNRAHSIIRVMFEQLLQGKTVSRLPRTSSVLTYLVRTENLTLLHHFTDNSIHQSSEQPLFECLRDLDTESLELPYRCTKSIRLQIYSDLIRSGIIPYLSTTCVELIFEVKSLTDQERLDLLGLHRKVQGVNLRFIHNRFTTLICAFLESRRLEMIYPAFLEILLEMNFKVPVEHHDIYVDYLMISIKGQFNPEVVYDLPKLSVMAGTMCLRYILDNPTTRIQLFNESLNIYHHYLSRHDPVPGHLMEILIQSDCRPDLLKVVDYLITAHTYQPAIQYLRQSNLRLTVSDLREKYPEGVNLIEIRHRLQARGFGFILTLSQEDEDTLKHQIESIREVLGDTAPGLITDMATLQRGQMVLFRGFDKAGKILVETVLRVKRSSPSRCHLGYSVYVIRRDSVRRNYHYEKLSWLDSVCQGPQPNYTVLKKKIREFYEITEVRLFRIPLPSLLQESILAVRSLHSRKSSLQVNIPSELREMIYPPFMTWI